MSWAEVSKINSKFMESPLDEIIENKPIGLKIGSGIYTNYSEVNNYLNNLQESNGAPLFSHGKSFQKDEYIYYMDSSEKVLKRLSIVTLETEILLTSLISGGSGYVIAVTDDYVYMVESDSNEYHYTRYDLATGAYKKTGVLTTENSVTAGFNDKIWLSYEGELFCFIKSKGFYKVTDNIDSNGTFTFTKRSSSSPENNWKDHYSFQRVYVELPDGYVAIAFKYHDSYSSSSYEWCISFTVVNIQNGQCSSFHNRYAHSNSVNDQGRCVLCPIKKNGITVGLLCGFSPNGISVYKMNFSTHKLEFLKSLRTSFQRSSTGYPDSFTCGYYDNESGIMYFYDGENSAIQIKDVAFGCFLTNAIYLLKGMRVISSSGLYPLSYKLKDILTFDGFDLGIKVPGESYPDSKGVIEVQQDDYYFGASGDSVEIL